jgi:hypothetical protein
MDIIAIKPIVTKSSKLPPLSMSTKRIICVAWNQRYGREGILWRKRDQEML